MRLEKIDLNLFVLFDALYQERGVTKVAQRLNITQPAVSNALGRLRQTFDDPLFVRTPSGMAPTPVADNVITDVRKALSLLGKSVGGGARFDPSHSEKVFRLGMNDMAEALLFPLLLKRIKSLAAGVSLTSYYVDSHSATDDLKSGSLDLLLDSQTVNAREFNQKKLAQLPYVVAMSKKHAKKFDSLTLDGYVNGSHLHVSSRRSGRGQVDMALHAKGLKRTIDLRVQSYLVAERVASQNDVFWTAPKLLADQTGLAQCLPPLPVEPLTWNLYWHKSAEDDPANQWIREQVMATVKQLLEG